MHVARSADGGWEPDPWVWDDQNAIVNVRGRGLVVVSGCSHAGAVNVPRNAQRLTGEQRIIAFIGGFHLTGGLSNPLSPPTVPTLKEIGVRQGWPPPSPGGAAAKPIAATSPKAF